MARPFVKVGVDKRAEKELIALLQGLAPKMRRRAINKALKRSTKDLVTATKMDAASMVESATVARSIQNVVGKYSRKGAPYVVIQHRNKLYDSMRVIHGIRMRTSTNWSKIGHLVNQGVAGGLRTAGTSIRQVRAGRKFKVVRNEYGAASYQRKSTTGKHFIVLGSRGQIHPVKKINHPGATSSPYFDTALQSTRPSIIRKTSALFQDTVKDFQRKMS